MESIENQFTELREKLEKELEEKEEAAWQEFELK